MKTNSYKYRLHIQVTLQYLGHCSLSREGVTYLFCAANVSLVWIQQLKYCSTTQLKLSAALSANLNQQQEIEKILRVSLMSHINRLYPPTLPCCPCEQKNMIWLLYHSANNLPIYISVRSHPPTSPQMSDWSAPCWSSVGPLSDPADGSERATHCCVWKWTASQRSLQIKKRLFPCKAHCSNFWPSIQCVQPL